MSYYLDYTETSFIDVVAEPSLTATAEMNAYQSNLTWMVADGTPSPNPSYPFTDDTGQLTVPGKSILSGVISGGDFSYSYPGANFLLQDGVPSPIYPTYKGALVLDLALKKWGKMKAEYKAILDYRAFNSANENVTSYSNLGVDMAILDSAGNLYNMDALPTDTFIRYGKIGYYRLGMTVLHEVRLHFRIPFSGKITLETSMNGVSLETSLKKEYIFNGVLNANCFHATSGKWHTIKISGNYDLQYIELRGTVSGRR